MSELFLKRDATLQVTSMCEKCQHDISFPMGSHDGDFATCTYCGNSQELRHTVGVFCPHCFQRVCGREKDVDNEFTCPVCGETYVLTLSDIELTVEEISYYRKLLETTSNMGQTSLRN